MTTGREILFKLLAYCHAIFVFPGFLIYASWNWMREPYGHRVAIGIGSVWVMCAMAWYNGTRVRRRIIR